MPQWSQLVKQEVTCWRDFHDYWIQNNAFFIRYEDLTRAPVETLDKVFTYLLGSIEGTDLACRIKQLAQQTKPQLYKPRANQNSKYS